MAKPDISRNKNVTVVELGPDYHVIDGAAVEELGILPELAKTIDPPRLLLSLSHTQYMNTAFLGLILRVFHQLKSRSGRFAVFAPLESTHQVFTTMRLDQLFDLFDSIDEAVRALSVSPE